MSASKTEDLIVNIERAFANVPYPGDDRLTESTYGDEPAALVRQFAGRTDRRALDAKFLDQALEDYWLPRAG
jgi:hypothetical protein